MAGPGLLGGAELVGTLLRQGRDIQTNIDQMFDEHAQQRAGDALTQGDTTGAAAILNSRGMLKDAQTLTDRQGVSDALSSINSGDFAAAKGSAAKLGDPALYGQVQAQQALEVKHRAEFLGNAADAISQIRTADPAQTQALRKQAFTDHIAPVLKSMGAPDDQIAQIAASDFSDQTIASFKASVGDLQKMTIQSDGNGNILGINPQTGETKVLYKGQQKKRYDKLKNGDGSESLIEIDPNVDSSAPAAATSAASAASAASPDASVTPAATGPVAARIGTVAGAKGAKPEEVAYLQRLNKVEDPSGDPNVKNGSSTGYFQFHPDTFAANGGKDIKSLDDQVGAALNLQRHDRATLKGLGVPATDANAYIMHQQGPGGGPALLTADPNKSAVDVLTPVYGDAKMARRAIVGNGGTPDMTAGQFVDYWHKRWAGAGNAAAGAPTSQTAVKSALSNDNLPAGVRILARSQGASESESALSDASVALVGSDYLMRGADALKNLGQGKVGVENKNRILNWASQQAEESGIKNPQVLARWVANKANVTALGKTQTTLSAIRQSEDTLLANMALAERLAKNGGVVDGIPLTNAPWQKARIAFGSADAKAYDNALITTANEYAKILTTTGGTGNAPTSDQAAREANKLFNSGQSLKQILASFAVAKTEADNRRAAIQAEHDFLVNEVSGQKPPATAPAPGGPNPAPPPPPAKPKKSLQSIFGN